MESIIQKAAKGNRAAMTQLYEANAVTVYCVCKALLRNTEQTVPATNWAIRSAFQAAEKGLVQTEEEFTAFAIKQGAGYCKREVAKSDPRAFKLPPKKEFRISHLNEQLIDPNAEDVENYCYCLPAIQRFAFVLQHLGDMDDLQIAKAIGQDSASVALIKEAETDNLSKIYRAVKTAGGRCSAPTKELIKAEFAMILDNAKIPDAVGDYIANYIDSIAAPLEVDAKNKGKKIGIIAAAVLLCVVVLVAIFAGSGNNTCTTSGDGDYFETSATDATDAADNTDATNTTDDIAASDLDPSAIYYADIEVEDYGTITVQLDQDDAPITVANFVKLAESAFYDGLTFHRIFAGFMIQGGDPNGDGTGGSDEEIVGEFASNGYENNLSHTRGVISMARSDDYDSASSQFFIVHEDSEFLDGEYAAFGWVTEGMDVVDAICKDAVPYDDNGMMYAEDQPIITSITIRTENTESEDTTEAADATEAVDSGTVNE